MACVGKLTYEGTKQYVQAKHFAWGMANVRITVKVSV